MIDFKNLHIGLTNRCRLLCPECPRNNYYAKYIHSMTDIDSEHFANFLVQCQPDNILFCGNWGDPIYAKNFTLIIKKVKSTFPNCSVSIHTNGSGKQPWWWKDLMSSLNERDTIVFSIDGVPENYNIYRINSSWENVLAAINTCVEYNKTYGKNINLHWKYIVFSYNEKDILTAYNLSKELGLTDFWLQEAIIAPNDLAMYDNEWLRPSRNFKEINNEFLLAISR